jgi:hypothetical protein
MATTTRNIMIATPCYGGLVTNYFLMSVLNLTRTLTAHTIAYDFRTISDSLITRARNHIANEFLHEAQFTHLFFIDADLGFEAEPLLRFLAFDKDVTCGVYPLKRLNVAALRASTAASDTVAEAASYTYSSTITINDDNRPDQGFLRAEYGATGFMLIRRQVLERMAAAYPDLRYGGDHAMRKGESEAPAKFAFFDTMIADGEYLPEDYSFCKRWRAIGGEIWIDLASRFSHIGNHVFAGDLGLAITEAQRLGQIK